MMPFGQTGSRVWVALLGMIAVLAPACFGVAEIELANIQVNLRKAPSTKSPIIRQLPPRSKAVVLERLDNWYRVKYCEHLTGYVHAALVVKPEMAVGETGSVDELIRQQATFAFAQRDWPEVVRLLDQTAGVARLDSGTGYMLGIACRELGKLDRAEAAFLKGIGRLERSWNAGSVELHRQLVGVQQRRRRWPQVVETTKRITDRFPTAVWAIKARAEAYLYLRKPTEALMEYRALLANEPGDVETLVGIGYAKAALSDVRGAEACFRAAIEKAPVNERAHLGLSELQLLGGRNADAEATLRRGVGAVPDSVRLRHKLSTVVAARQAAERRAMLMAKRDQIGAQQAAAGIATYRFTVMSRLGSKLYEIRLDDGNMALLQTNRSVFSGPGLHEIPLSDGGNAQPRLTTKHRNIPANTRLLKELTDTQAARYRQAVLELHAVNQALEKTSSEADISTS